VIQRGGIAWVSYEPALGPLSIVESPLTGFYYNVRPDWIIFGGESGNGRRECKREWADRLLFECGFRHETKFFVKQMGGRTPADGKAAIPPELRIQEFPV
jgi:protein gp37